MKLKHLLAMAGVAVMSSSAWAQTDVTSTYLVNPSFETLKATDGTTEVTVKSTLSSGLYGWIVPSMSNYQVESEVSKSSTGFPADGSGAITPSDGTYYYFNRQGWGNKNSELKTTTSQVVPVGTYYLCFDYKAADYSNNNKAGNNGTTIGIQVKDASDNVVGTTPAVRRAYSITNNSSNPGNDTYMVTAPWTQLGVIITVEEASVLTIAIQQDMKNNGRSDIAYDNMRLYQLTDNTDLTGLISNPSFETGYHANTGWTNNNSSDNGVKKNSNETYTITDNHGTYIFNSWGGSSKNYITQTVKGLPDGVYTVTATLASFADEKAILKAGSAETEHTATGKGTGDEVSVQVKMLAGDLVIEASNTKDNDNANSDNSFIKADNFKLKYDRALTAQEIEELKLPTAKATLKSKIDAIIVPTTNIGDGAFQYPSTGITAITTAKEAAQGVYDDAEASLAEVNEQLAIVEALAAPALNAPTAGQRFHLNLKDRGTITFSPNSSAQGGYDVTFLTESNNYPQGCILTPAAGAAENDMYIMSFVEANGSTRYICNGIPYSAGTGAYGIRTIDDAEKALVVKVVATATEGEYNILNTSTDGGYKKLGSNGGGFYTDDKYSTFTIAEAQQASANLKITDAKYGTFIAPFAAAIPSGVTAYKVSDRDGDVLTLVEDNDGFDANAPYIVYSESTVNDNLQGWGLATENTYKEGLLTGVYAETNVEDGWYVLQNNNDVVGFYQVDTQDAENPTPSELKVPANRAYLTVPASSANVRAFRLDNNANAIEAISAIANNAIEAIYNANGVKVNALQKGINVVKMQNGKTQKVLVK